MTKKQHKEIARMWVAAFANASGGDSFESDIDQEDVNAIIQETEGLAYRILGNRPMLHTLPQIIDYVLTKRR